MRLSLIIPVYNVAPYLRESLDSLLAQTYDDWEAICVDDGSTDGCGEILDKYAAADSRIRAIHQANTGVSAARNHALDAARGEWIGFLDADDCIASWWLETVVVQMQNNPQADVIRVRDLVSVWPKDDMGMMVRTASETGAICGSSRVYEGKAAVEWGLNRWTREGWSYLNFVRRDMFGDLRFCDGLRIKEDVVFFSSLAERIGRAVEFKADGYFYRRRDGSALRSFRDVRDCVRFADAMMDVRNTLAPALMKKLASRALGYDLLQWMNERDWSRGYDGEACPLRTLWRKRLADGSIDLKGVWPWWRHGIRKWLRTGDLGLLQKTWKVRAWFGRLVD